MVFHACHVVAVTRTNGFLERAERVHIRHVHVANLIVRFMVDGVHNAVLYDQSAAAPAHKTAHKDVPRCRRTHCTLAERKEVPDEDEDEDEDDLTASITSTVRRPGSGILRHRSRRGRWSGWTKRLGRDERSRLRARLHGNRRNEKETE